MSRDAFQIAESIIAGNPPSAAAWEWVAEGLRKWAGGMPLDAALDGLDRAATASLDGLREAHDTEGDGGA